MVPLTQWRPMPLIRVQQPFDHPGWLYELKHDGFRALAVVEGHRCTLISRGGHVFKQWPQLAEELAHTVPADHAILDGEIVCLRADGTNDFNALLFRRDWPHFYAFDLLKLEDRDLRSETLRGRKRELRRLVPRTNSRLRFVDHLPGRGNDLYAAACARDTEGIVAKWAAGPYHTDGVTTSWIKVRNPDYSQAPGRHELFSGRGDGNHARWKPRRYRMDPRAARAW